MESAIASSTALYPPAPEPVAARHAETRWQSDRIGRVIAYLRRNMAEPVTLKALADVACCSPWHLDRVFGDVTGLTPLAFLTALRLEAARSRVVSSEARIIEIAYDVGYNSLGSFGKRFTATVGMAPRLLRRSADRFDVDRFRAVMQAVARRPAASPAKSGSSVYGTVRLASEAGAAGGFVLIGLFPDRVAGVAPAACCVVRLPGEFSLRAVEEGSYTLLALAFLDAHSAEQTLSQSASPRARRVGLRLTGNGPLNAGEVLLGAPRPEDPPIVPVFPILLEQRA